MRGRVRDLLAAFRLEDPVSRWSLCQGGSIIRHKNRKFQVALFVSRFLRESGSMRAADVLAVAVSMECERSNARCPT